MDVHLIDGTYELFRYYSAVPSATDANGQEIGAVTHIGVATDHVVESFRNDLYPGYKTSEGVPQELLSQFPILEEALEAIGVIVWPMVHYEADDALFTFSTKSEQLSAAFQCVRERKTLRENAYWTHFGPTNGPTLVYAI